LDRVLRRASRDAHRAEARWRPLAHAGDTDRPWRRHPRGESRRRSRGIVAKRRDSRYRARPARRQLAQDQETPPVRSSSSAAGLRAAAARDGRIGRPPPRVYDESRALQYGRRVGSRLTPTGPRRLQELLTPLIRDTSPFTPGPTKPPRTGNLHPTPRFVVEVEFREWTKTVPCEPPPTKASAPTRHPRCQRESPHDAQEASDGEGESKDRRRPVAG